MKFKCTITVNYPETEVEAAIPDGPVSIDEICRLIKTLSITEPDMTSFTLIAVRVKE